MKIFEPKSRASFGGKCGGGPTGGGMCFFFHTHISVQLFARRSRTRRCVELASDEQGYVLRTVELLSTSKRAGCGVSQPLLMWPSYRRLQGKQTAAPHLSQAHAPS